MRKEKNGLATNEAVPQYHQFDTTDALRRRRATSRRLAPLRCGCADPWTCRCRPSEPSELEIDAYAATLAHLDAIGLTAAPQVSELRALWRRGGQQRRVAQSVTQHWEVA